MMFVFLQVPTGQSVKTQVQKAVDIVSDYLTKDPPIIALIGEESDDITEATASLTSAWGVIQVNMEP